MDMPRFARRQFLRAGTTLVACLPTAGLLAAEVPRAQPLALSAQGEADSLLVDTTVRRFSGAGLYLYPDWGTPALYRVRQLAGGDLAWHDPRSGELLWRASDQPELAAFAGRVVASLGPAELAGLQAEGLALQALQVPGLPVA